MTTLMMDKPVGGRGNKVPYETKQMRVPEDLEPQIHKLISRYREWVFKTSFSGIALPKPPQLLDINADSSSKEPVDNLKDEIERLVKLVDNLKIDNESLTQERDALDREVNQLQAQNGELNLQVLELKEHLKLVDKLDKLAVGVSNKAVDKIIEPAVGSESKLVDSLNDLPIISEDKLVDKINEAATNSGNKPVDKINNSKLEPMSQRQLAVRLLETSRTTVARNRENKDFTTWSRGLDPDGVGWRFDPKSKKFYPVDC